MTVTIATQEVQIGGSLSRKAWTKMRDCFKKTKAKRAVVEFLAYKLKAVQTPILPKKYISG
jgi:hypothetical protein